MSFTQAIARAAGARIASRVNPAAISLPRSVASQPNALGVPTRLAAARLHEAGIVLKPLLRSAGLSVSQINRKRPAHRRCQPDQVSGACRRSIERSCAWLQAGARRGTPAGWAAPLRYSFVADARRCAGPDSALLFDRQRGPRSAMRRNLQFHDCLALCRRRQTFRSATDGIFCDMAYPFLQGFNVPPSEPDRRPVHSSPLGRGF